MFARQCGRIIVATTIVFLFLSGPSLHAAEQAGIQITELPPPAETAELAVIPWVKPGEVDWQQGDPAFQVEDKTIGLAAKGWLAVTAREIQLRIVARITAPP